MLTLPPKRRGREQAACWQLLRFAAGLTRPDGTSARVFRQPRPVETTHPHRTEPPFGTTNSPIRSSWNQPSPHVRAVLGAPSAPRRVLVGSPGVPTDGWSRRL